MAHRIEERFTVHAPAAKVWAYLVDAPRVVRCLPGAEIGAAVDDRTFDGNVKVKLGPVTVAYQGRIRFAEMDEAGLRVRMTGEGREAGGAGTARMAMESRLAALPDGSTEVVVRADVDLAGRIVQLGRGLVEQVAHQLFQEFAQCVRRTLEEPVPGAAAPPRAEAVRAIPLLLRALRAWLAEILRRLFGGKGR